MGPGYDCLSRTRSHSDLRRNMSHKIRNLVLAATFAIGVTASGAAAASVLATSPNPAPTGAGPSQTGDSVNDNKDDGAKGQAGVQESGDTVNDSKNDGASGQSSAGTNQ